ncbi:hypothetical protein SKAU_G00029700 [Synaphobranchus kaupii]|uniref:rRNA N(6)-adenosine-methyltransferase ZCCHC4 n=1 Tax=Synaphobranchus kaupii TaxID=118154 RepID=A0A9Q1GE14_SYNKA|nr:hypothetical protein SKAU_G00029700 [Synaphobranchus kaupii]
MDSEFSDGEGFGIEVILSGAKDEKAPCCPHGPALLFEKLCRGEQQGRRFYACSACRDRKDCSFFQWEDEKVSQARLLAREKENQSKQPPFSHQEYCSRFREFVSLPLDQRRFCQECQLLLHPKEWSEHATHRALSDDITVARLRRPSLLLCPLENKKSNAQYLFADRSCHFLLDLLASLGFNKVLCVGTPRLHELIKIRNQETGREVLTSLLLDIDFRYAQFYSEEEFCHYNMFNHHFFNRERAEAVFNAFLHEEGHEKVVLVTDPPFGGLVKPLAHSFSQVSDTWKTLQSPGSGSQEMPMVWIFPYFFESRILECFPSFSMLDYQVDYDNHPLYKHGKTGRKQSPVRLFTNLCPLNIVLPGDEGYRLCSICERYVSSGNRHCPICNACTSKDGRAWRHCTQCNKCVKPSWLHCPVCDHCALPDHPCGRGPTGCFTCSSLRHKRRACPHSNKRRENRGQAAGRRPGANLSKQPASRVKGKKGKPPSHASKARKVT